MWVEAKEGVIVIDLKQPITQIQNKFKEFEHGFKKWQRKSVAFGATVEAARGATIGAVYGGLSASLYNTNKPQVLALRPLIELRNYAVSTAAYAAIFTVMERLRGKADVQTSMVAGFGSGALMYSLASGMFGPFPNQAVNAVKHGLVMALLGGGIFKFQETFSELAVEDRCYRSMLANLGLQKYVNNFKEGLLRDNTHILLSDRELTDLNFNLHDCMKWLDELEGRRSKWLDLI